MIFLLFAFAFFGSWVGVALVRRYALKRLLDVPNDRSSHRVSTPRGGGLGLAAAHMTSLTLANSLSPVPPELLTALTGGGLAVAIIGFQDDHGHVNASLRLLCHFLVFAWAVWWLGGLPPVNFGWGAVSLGWIGTGLLMLYLAWFLNLFNFMDGIDGIAGMQAITMAATAASLATVTSVDWHETLPLWLLVAATAGFLVWNWPPAKIFMGDVGSGYLGYTLGVLALQTVSEGWLTPWVWLILGGSFLADATVTLIVRARNRVAIASAHRSHVYQRLARHWCSHRRVTMVFTLVNVFWLVPWALLAAMRPAMGMMATVAALAPLFAFAIRLGAGQPGDFSAR